MIATPGLRSAVPRSVSVDWDVDVRATSTAICPRCNREQTINTAATPLTELHYCLICKQSFLLRRLSAEPTSYPVDRGRDFPGDVRHAAACAPQPGDVHSGRTMTCHWFWRYPSLVIGGLCLTSMLLYAWQSM